MNNQPIAANPRPPRKKWWNVMLFIGLAAIGNGCAFFTRDVDASELVQPPKVFVQSFICPQDTLLTVAVSYVTPAVGSYPTNENYSDAVRDAIVTLSDGIKTVTLTIQRLGDFAVSADSLPIRPGQTYFLRVTTPGNGKTYSASCTVPVDLVGRNTVTFTAERANEIDYETVQWRDLPGTPNYYSVLVARYTVQPTLGTPDYQVGYYGLSDQGNEGGTITVSRVDAQRYPFGDPNIGYVFICHTDYSYHEFHRRLQAQDGEQRPFAEPFPLYSNIENGLGVFAAYNRLAIRTTRRQ